MLPVAPWLLVGWGDLTADPAKGVVTEAMAQLGFGAPTRDKDAQFCEFQTGIIQARHFYWDSIAPNSDSAGTTADPFEYCGAMLF